MLVAMADMHGDGATLDLAPGVHAPFTGCQLSNGPCIGADYIGNALGSPPVVLLVPINGSTAH